MNMKDYGLTPDMTTENEKGIPARVIAVHKERYALFCEYGETYGRLKTKEYYGGFEEFPTVGDFVRIDYIPGSDSRIIATLPRKTFFSRRDPDLGRGEQIVAANFDYVFIMQSLNQDFNEKRLERYLTLTLQSGAVPVVVLTKADLVEEQEPYIRCVERIVPGVKVHAISARSGLGLEGLKSYLEPGKTVALLGSSGIGKSSLVNALTGQELMRVNGIREDDSKGRHTTTHRQLIMLKNGSMIIDTPGMRELGMWDVSEGLGEAFADVEQYIGRCRFSNCRHLSEPGCAIKAAIASGELPKERWDSYCKLKREAKYSDAKDIRMREKQKRNKGFVKKSDRSKTEWTD